MEQQSAQQFPAAQCSDYAHDPPTNPNPIPNATVDQCTRINTRVLDPHTGSVAIVANVLVPTRRTRNRARQANTNNKSNESSSDDSSSSDDDSDSEDEMGNVTNGVNGMELDPPPVPATSLRQAYWLQRTLRTAIYGRVRFAVVLRERRRPPGFIPNPEIPWADWEVTNEQVAVKEMEWQLVRQNRNRLAENPINEVGALCYLKVFAQMERAQAEAQGREDQDYAPHVLLPKDLLSDDRNLYCISPFCNGGELFDLVEGAERFTEKEARYWMKQVLHGLGYLQRVGICHRDLSLENLLVHDRNCLVIDLGMCLSVPFENNNVEEPNNRGRRLLMPPQGTCGKWSYMSPEVALNEQPFDGFSIDMWAAGVILFLMVTGFPPWDRATDADERFRYMSRGYLKELLTQWDLGLSDECMDLLQKMLYGDPRFRLSLRQVWEHPWINMEDDGGV